MVPAVATDRSREDRDSREPLAREVLRYRCAFSYRSELLSQQRDVLQQLPDQAGTGKDSICSMAGLIVRILRAYRARVIRRRVTAGKLSEMLKYRKTLSQLALS